MQTEQMIPDYQQARVLVYGDLILDRYWYGDVARVSPEAPVPVVHVQDQQAQPGGAANVALNIESLGGSVDLLGIVGEDEEANILSNLLSQENIHLHWLTQSQLPTVTKLRVVGQNQQLLRMDFEQLTQTVDDSELRERYQQQLAQANVVVFSDYAKNTLTHVENLIAMARAQGKIILVDPKQKDFSCYRGADLITPNRKEFESIVGPCADQQTLVLKARGLLERVQIKAILITLGKEGMLLVQQQQAPLLIPTRARQVYDVTGAGDTVIAVIAASLAAGCELVQACQLANFAAGVVVSKFGAASVSIAELRRAVQAFHHSHLGVLTQAELNTAITDARAHAETIVMTNGCFDILHAGHIEYLEAAKALGDRLIVAVNDDQSVRRLKGNNRPLNSLTDRMDVLASLRPVDWVIPFSEDTPQQLIKTIMPDILVKGADYQIADIAGAKEVLANGGRVETIALREGLSTSKLINKILRQEVLA